MNKILEIIWPVCFLFVLALLFAPHGCSKNPGEPEPTPDPCLECPPVFIQVPGDSVFVVCDEVDLTVEFTVKKDQSQPNDYVIEREGFPDEPVSITDTSPAPVDTSFTRVFENYTGERFSIKIIAGSKAETIGVAIIDLKCSE